MIEIYLVNGEKIIMDPDISDEKNYVEFYHEITNEKNVIEISTIEYGNYKYYIIPKSKILYLRRSESEKERKEKEERLKKLENLENFNKKVE